MSNIKFDEFSYANELILLSDALAEDGTLLDCYDRFSLYCPYCRSARLKFFSASSQKNAYLATWPADVHTEECPASFTPAKKKELTNFFDKLSSSQIQDKLNAYLRRFTSKKDGKSLKNNVTNRTVVVSIADKSTSSKKRYILPQKSLKTSVKLADNSLRNIPILFYGRVYIDFELHQNGEMNRIVLKNEFSKNPFLHMNNGLSKLNIPKNIDKDTLYMIVFIGKYKPSEDYPDLIKPGAFSVTPADQ